MLVQRDMHTTMIALIMSLSSDMGIALLSEEDRDDIEDTYELIIQVAWCVKLVQIFYGLVS